VHGHAHPPEPTPCLHGHVCIKLAVAVLKHVAAPAHHCRACVLLPLALLVEQLEQPGARMPDQADLGELKLSVATFGTKFDVVLVDPPWEEYARRAPGAEVAVWPWQDIMRLEIEAVVDTPSFLFLWCARAHTPACAPVRRGSHCMQRALHARTPPACAVRGGSPPCMQRAPCRLVGLHHQM
jgi:mRNA (2'-O-methyladenosine-N6-)-methyltransferase